MDFFDFLFGKKEGKSPNKGQESSNNKTSENVNENKPFPPVQPSQQSNTVSTKPVNSGISPVEQYVKEKHSAKIVVFVEPPKKMSRKMQIFE